MVILEGKRKEIVAKAARRIVHNMQSMSGYAQQVYIEKLVNMLDETALIALDFSLEMAAPEPAEQEKGTNGKVD